MRPTRRGTALLLVFSRPDIRALAAAQAPEQRLCGPPAHGGRHGDFSAVPLAPDFAFTGPVASFDTAERFREMAAQAGPMVTRFSVRRQFVNGDTVCSIIDWEMALPIAATTSAEILEVRDGQIVRGELIYDAQELRSAMAAGA